MSPSVMGNAEALDVLLNNVDSLELKKLVPSPSTFPLVYGAPAQFRQIMKIGNRESA